MQLKFYHSTSHPAFSVPENAGLDHVVGLLQSLDDSGVSVTVIDTTTMSEHERAHIYFDTVASVAVPAHVKMRRVFGSKGKRGTEYFGREVPALLVYCDDSTYPADIYPQQKGSTVITIRDYLGRLSSQPSLPT